MKIVGNPSYNISTLRCCSNPAEYGNQVTDMHFMLQKKWWKAWWPSCNADYGRLCR